ncbi:hypothetical protein [Endozoicomonas sp. ALB032]|uniref:hypothetical protein n=1 Tax=Endozoicomonas sp. ALB032 TaxID=3403082 RepID=UPI003BB4CBA1
MIRSTGTANSPIQTAKQGSTEKKTSGKPDDIAQKNNITPKTDGNGIQQRQTISLSSRVITDLNSDSNNPEISPSPSSLQETVEKVASNAVTKQKVGKNRRLQEVDGYFEPLFNAISAKRPTLATAWHCQSVPEASGPIGQDRRATQQIAPSRPYPGHSSYESAFMDNSPRSNFSATYANVPVTVNPETVQIGNQRLITLDRSQAFVDPTLVEDRIDSELYNFSFLADFLRQNNTIEYIVDIGCGNAEASLSMQNYLNEKTLPIKVIPVDVSNAYAGKSDVATTLPINLIPAQEIAGASPATTLFTAIHPYTDSGSVARQLSREIAQGMTDYYLTRLIKNNPGCFVLATEDPYLSSPQRYIPPELVYTKHYQAFANDMKLDDYETNPNQEAKAMRMNAEKGDIHRLNHLLAKLPEERAHYLASIPAIKEKLQVELPGKPERARPDKIFKLYLDKMASTKGFRLYRDIKYDLVKNGLEMRCWHVYRQDINASEVSSQAAKEPYFSNGNYQTNYQTVRFMNGTQY